MCLGPPREQPPVPSLTEPPTPPYTQGLSALSHPASRAEQDSALFKEEMDTVLSALQAFPLTLTSAQCAENLLLWVHERTSSELPESVYWVGSPGKLLGEGLEWG